MCNFFNKCGYPASVVPAGHHLAQQIDRQSAQPRSEINHSKKHEITSK